MRRKTATGLAVLVVGLLVGSLAARAERLEGQYRGPTDRPSLVRETEDTTIQPAERAGGEQAQAGERRAAGETAPGEGSGGSEAPPPAPEGDPPSEEPPPYHGGAYRGPASGDTPPSERNPEDPQPDDGSDPGSSEAEAGSARGDAPSANAGGGGGGAAIGGGSLARAPGGGKAKTDATEAFKLWSFYWEHNRERLLHDLVEARRAGASFAPWGSSWVLGRGDKSERRIRPVTRGLIVEEILPLLQRRRLDGNALIRDAAVIALGKAGGKAVVPMLVDSATSDPDAEVREDATLALGLTRRTEALPTLLHIVRGTDIPGGTSNVNQRCFAAFALGLLGEADAVPVLSEELRRAVRAGADEQLAASLALGIGLLGQEESVGDLAPYLHSPQASRTVKAYVASALGKLGQEDAVRALQVAWKKSDPVVRGSIALALGSYREAPVVAFLDEEGLGDGEGQNQNFAAVSLARIGSDLPFDSVPRRLVLARLHERATRPQRNTTLAQYAALGLAMVGEEAAAPDLRELSASRSQRHEVRSAMALSVGILGDPAALEGLREVLASRGEDPKLRGYAALGLAFLGDERQAPFLKEQYRRADGARDAQRGCVLALGILGDARDVEFLVDEVLTRADEATVRGAAAIALGMMRESTAVPRLVNLAESRDRRVSVEDKAFAVAALGYLADKDPYPYLSRVFDNCNYRHEYPQLAELLRIL